MKKSMFQLRKLQAFIDDVKQFGKEENILMFDDAAAMWRIRHGKPLSEPQQMVVDNLSTMKCYGL